MSRRQMMLDPALGVAQLGLQLVRKLCEPGSVYVRGQDAAVAAQATTLPAVHRKTLAEVTGCTHTQTLSEALRSAAAQLSMASARATAETDALQRRAEEAEAQLSTARAAADQMQRVRTLS